MFVVRIDDAYIKNGETLPPKRLLNDNAGYYKTLYDNLFASATTTDLQKARVFNTEGSARAAVYRGGKRDFDLLPVALTIL